MAISLLGNIYSSSPPLAPFSLQVVRDCRKWRPNWEWMVAVHDHKRMIEGEISLESLWFYCFMPVGRRSLIGGSLKMERKAASIIGRISSEGSVLVKCPPCIVREGKRYWAVSDGSSDDILKEETPAIKALPDLTMMLPQGISDIIIHGRHDPLSEGCA